jgi:hypothetical protein
MHDDVHIQKGLCDRCMLDNACLLVVYCRASGSIAQCVHKQ